jgi:hypothetical protein
LFFFFLTWYEKILGSLLFVEDKYLSLCTEKTKTVELLRVVREFSSLKLMGIDEKKRVETIISYFSEKK